MQKQCAIFGLHLYIVLVYGLREVVHIHLPIEGKGSGALYKTLNLCATEVLGALRQLPQVHVCAQEGVLRHLACVDLQRGNTRSHLHACSQNPLCS